MICRRAIISGRVQGVGYRAWVAREARVRGLRGFVRNLGDGSVEAVFAGNADDVAAMIAACRAGPRLAAVTGIAESEFPVAEWKDFSVSSG